MNLGDQVVVLDDEPDYIEFQLADGRFFTAIDSSLSPARSV